MGVGTRLAQKFQHFGYGSSGGCNCKSLAAKMDKEGPDWCEANIDELVSSIRDNSRKMKTWFSHDVAVQFIRAAISEERQYQLALQSSIAAARNSRIEEVIRDIKLGYRLHEPGWNQDPDVIEAHRRVIREKIDLIEHPDPMNLWQGNGIVTLGGGVRYFPSAWVLCKMLREIGVELPIEWWYLNDLEMDERMIELAESIPGVKCVNASRSLGGHPRCYGGWEIKAWAIQHSRFEKVLFLDADVVPVMGNEITEIFINIGQFNSTKAIAWMNYDHAISYSTSSVAFRIIGDYVPGTKKHIEGSVHPTDYKPWETGILAVNKRSLWKEMEVAKILSDHSDFFYPRNEHNLMNWHSYGDTGTFMLAIGEGTSNPGGVEIAPHKPTFFGSSRGGGLDHYGFITDFNEGPVFQHRTQPKYKLRVSGENKLDGLVYKDLVKQFLDELASKWRPYVWDWRNQKPEESSAAAAAIGPKHITGLPLNSPKVSLLPDGKIEGGSNLRWRMATLHGQQKLVIAGPQQGLAILDETPNGWLDREHGVHIQHMAPSWWSGMDTPLQASVWCEVFLRNAYRLPDRIDGWNVIDIGANEGVFSHLCYERGANSVVSVEPGRENYANLLRNTSSRERSLCLHAAVIRYGATDPAWINLKNFHDFDPHASGLSITDSGFPTCPTISVDKLLYDALQLLGSIDLLKIDAEFSEWPILLYLQGNEETLPKAIVAELHYGALFALPDFYYTPKDRSFCKNEVQELLARLGYEVVILDSSESKDFGYLWAWRGQCPFFPNPKECSNA